MDYSNIWIRWMLLCVTTVSYNFRFNCSSIAPVVSKRGLHQGDPLSPYLFLLCVEGLSTSISKAANSGRLHGCKISPSAPSVSHLLFADDSFLFFRATREESIVVKEILNVYEQQSGQSINFDKSGIYFSANVRLDKQEELKDILLVRNDLSTTKYKGFPSLIGHSKKAAFNFVKDKVWKIIQSWSSKLLSRAGKAVLLKSVAQSIPSYCMSCFLLPKTLCHDIEK